MPVCRLRTHHSATTTPPKHRHHPAHCENDCGGGLLIQDAWSMLIHVPMDMLLWCSRLRLGEPVCLHDDHTVHIQTLEVEGGVCRSGPQDVATRFGHRWVDHSGSVMFSSINKRQCNTNFFFIDDLPKKKPPQLYKPSNPDTLAYLDFSVSTTGMLAGVKVTI